MNTLSRIALGGVALLALAANAEQSPITQVQRLTMDAAITIAEQAIAACREKGVQVGVTVVDRNGIPQLAMRDTLAPPITLSVSEGKAYAAVMFSVPTAALAERANTPIGRVPGVVMSTGGLPIQAAGALIGGVGVSGAPGGEIDEACAQAGIDAVQMDLEMAL